MILGEIPVMLAMKQELISRYLTWKCCSLSSYAASVICCGGNNLFCFRSCGSIFGLEMNMRDWSKTQQALTSL